MSDIPAITGAFAGFAGGAFALIRFALAQARAITDQFVRFLEQAMRRQESINERFERSIAQLAESVRENSILLNRVVERLGEGPTR